MKRFVQSLLAMKPVAVQFRLMVMAVMLVAGPMASAELSVSKLFGDGMVLQRDKPVKVWGWAEPGEAVTVSFAGQAVDTKADAQGKWVATFEPMEASFDSRNVVVAGKSQTLTIKDVLVGEVWLCGGQSNMAWSLGGSLDSGIEIASANTPAIRYLKLGLVASNEIPRDVPLEEGKGWLPCMPESARDCTAVGYYFAKRIQRRLNVPVGIIENAWGGTMAQYWCSRPTLETFPAMKKDLDAFDASVKAWIDGGEEAGAQKRLDAAIVEWEVDRMEALREERRVPGKPKLQIDPRTLRQPAGMYNTLVAPMAGLSLRGVLFYQGENNAFGEGWKPFIQTFPAVISEWRKVFDDEELPFGLIQIAGWSNRRSMSYDQNHHTNIVREVQFKAWQATPNTGLIVTYDTNSDGNIHPRKKEPVGERSARWALTEVYDVKGDRDERIAWRGPVYESYKVDGDKVVVQFDKSTAGGLRLDKDDARGFYIAGEDQVFHHAQARADGHAGTVTLSSSAVKQPVAVRYAISNLPLGSLMNGKEIPAYPFRTDTWPIRPHHSSGSYQADKPNPVVEDEVQASSQAELTPDKKPLKVFILSGQSNMTGRGALGELNKPHAEQQATLVKFIKQPANVAKYKFLYDGKDKTDNGWTLRDDVFISLGEWPRIAEGQDGYSPWAKHGKFGPYYGGRRNNGFGPELAIGHLLGDHYDQTVVLIKIAYGGNSLAGNFRPPSSGGTLGDKYPKVVETVNTALKNLDQIVPGYTEGQGYEIVGLFWNQGLSDVMAPAIDEYQQNLVNLINDWRKAFNAPDMLVSIGVTGNWGWEYTELIENEKISDEDRDAYISGMKKLAAAQLAVPKLDAFKGNVVTAETRDFWRTRPEHGGRGTETHWMANGESYWLIGEVMGKAMMELIEAQ